MKSKFIEVKRLNGINSRSDVENRKKMFNYDNNSTDIGSNLEYTAIHQLRDQAGKKSNNSCKKIFDISRVGLLYYFGTY